MYVTAAEARRHVRTPTASILAGFMAALRHGRDVCTYQSSESRIEGGYNQWQRYHGGSFL